MILNPVIAGKSLPDIANPGTAADLLVGKQLIGPDGEVISGSMPSVAQATPSITVSSGGLITAKADQSGGKVDAGSRSATKQLTTQGGKTVTPGTIQQTAVYSGRYTTGNIYVAGDPDLKPENIKSGVNIFGVAGSLVNREIHMVTMQGNNSTELLIQNVEHRPVVVCVCVNGAAVSDSIVSSMQVRGGVKISQIVRDFGGSSSVFNNAGNFTYSSSTKELVITGFLNYLWRSENQYAVAYV